MCRYSILWKITLFRNLHSLKHSNGKLIAYTEQNVITVKVRPASDSYFLFWNWPVVSIRINKKTAHYYESLHESSNAYEMPDSGVDRQYICCVQAVWCSMKWWGNVAYTRLRTVRLSSHYRCFSCYLSVCIEWVKDVQPGIPSQSYGASIAIMGSHGYIYHPTQAAATLVTKIGGKKLQFPETQLQNFDIKIVDVPNLDFASTFLQNEVFYSHFLFLYKNNCSTKISFPTGLNLWSKAAPISATTSPDTGWTRPASTLAKHASIQFTHSG